MDNTVTIAIISGLCVAIPSIVATVMTSHKDNVLQNERINVIQKEITKLADKVEKHNNFGLELAKLETRVEIIEKKA